MKECSFLRARTGLPVHWRTVTLMWVYMYTPITSVGGKNICHSSDCGEIVR